QLAEKYPRRVPIEFDLARYLLEFDQAERALPHARRAFLALPGTGQRLLLVQCFQNSRRFGRTLALLAQLSEENPLVLEMRARAMSHEPRYMKASTPLLHRHLERQAKDGGMWLALAQVQATCRRPLLDAPDVDVTTESTPSCSVARETWPWLASLGLADFPLKAARAEPVYDRTGDCFENIAQVEVSAPFPVAREMPSWHGVELARLDQTLVDTWRGQIR